MRIRLYSLSLAILFSLAASPSVSGQPLAYQSIPEQERERNQGQRPPQPVPGEEGQGAEVRINNAQKDRLESQRNVVPPTTREIEEEPLTEFQQFLLAATGKRLPIYGRGLFRQVPSTFAPVDRVPVTPDYVIGPGDEIMIRAWGQIDVDYRATVDRVGNIFVPKVGNLSVAGLRYEQLEPFLRTAFQRVFRNFDLNVTMGQLRSIQIFMVGHAHRPGSYTVSSLTTLVNAIFATAGPSRSGTMRGIQLKRNGKTVTEFDLYDLLLKGDKSRDVQLLPGDVIYIGPAGPLAAVVGSVAAPAIYEMKEGSTFAELIQASGGLTSTALTERATIERISGGQVRSLEEIELTPTGLSAAVKDGDLLTVRSLTERFENAVTLRGNVAQPGRYPWRSGMRVRDLIPSREALITRAYYRRLGELGVRADEGPYAKDPRYARDQGKDDKADIETRDMAKAADDVSRSSAELMKEYLREKREAEVKRKASDVGATALRTEVERGIDINWDYAVIQRLDRESLTTSLLPFNLGKAIADAADGNNLTLQAGDVVTIFSQDDLKVPITRQNRFVTLEGEFLNAGVYQVLPGESLQNVIARAGGLTPQAYLFGSEFTRESVREMQQKRFDEFVDRLERDVERMASTRSQNVTSVEEAAGLKDKVDSQRRLVEKLRTTKAPGRLVLGLRTDQTGVDSIPDISLENGDRFVIPYRPATINVIGAVNNENSFLHQPGRSPAYYLRKAGGGTRQGDTGHTFIVRADGSIVGRGGARGWFGEGFEGIQLMPGDTIVVPERLNQTSILKGLRDWSQVFYQMALGVAAVRTFSRD